jgi:hypothetical protein
MIADHDGGALGRGPERCACVTEEFDVCADPAPCGPCSSGDGLLPDDRKAFGQTWQDHQGRFAQGASTDYQ